MANRWRHAVLLEEPIEDITPQKITTAQIELLKAWNTYSLEGNLIAKTITFTKPKIIDALWNYYNFWGIAIIVKYE